MSSETFEASRRERVGGQMGRVLAAVLGAVLLGVISASAQSLVGSYQVGNGPDWHTSPPTYSCVEACALLFGGSPGSYACSTVSTSINHMAFESVLSRGACSTFADTYKLGTTYSSVGDVSAYVDDNCYSGQTNYCFTPGAPAPALSGIGLVGLAVLLTAAGCLLLRRHARA
jgi:hypothetical protein